MRSSVFLVLIVAICAFAAIPERPTSIPALQWELRSDWLNVKDFGAKGDGVADDTAAIQTAFARLTDTNDWLANLHNRVIYFPAGRYRITQTLELPKSHGAWIVGHGRDTVLAWDGADDGVMTLSNGCTYARYEGLTWDGAGKAYTGMKHESQSYYETSIRYQYCAFFNIRAHGVLIGTGKEKTATAEVWFLNCLFRECGCGVSLLNFNNYDNTFDGCEFEDCSIGINSGNGNFYARGCHFLRSKVVDARQAAPSHASSLRLCTSQSSKRFFETPPWGHLSMKIEDCRVDSWTATDGAILLGKRGPTTIADCVFTNPPNDHAPITLNNPQPIQQLLIVCNNSSPGTAQVVDQGPNARVTVVPAGKRPTALTDASRIFLRQRVQAAGKVFDVVRDFGAKGNGAVDDTDAMQQAIDAARAWGKRAVVYLPGGQYKITRTLQVSGGNYSISGIGFRSILQWGGEKTGEMLRVHQPQGVLLEHFDLEGPPETVRIHQSADPGASLVYYDGIYTNGCDEATTQTKGIWCDRLPKEARVRMGHVIGNVTLTDCGAASVLCAVHFYTLTIEGATAPKTGIAGFMFHNDACHYYALNVLDDQDVIVADFYSESNKRYLRCTGTDGQPGGRVTLGASKVCTIDKECITIENYRGRIFVGGGDGYNQNDWGKPLAIRHVGARPVDFTVAGMGWWALAPEFTPGDGMQYASVENLLIENKYPEYNEKSLPNSGIEQNMPSIIAAFDDFRELAAAYLKGYYPD
jgi:hypothetical protein